MADIDFSKIVWLKGIHCSSINLVESGIGTKIIGVCSFNELDGLHGSLMTAVRNRWYPDEEATFTIDPKCTSIVCKPMIYDKVDTVTVAYDRHNCSTTTGVIKRRLTPIMRTENLGEFVNKRMSCNARVNLAFVNVTVDIDKVSQPNSYTISYDSFHVVYNPSLYARSNVELLG